MVIALKNSMFLWLSCDTLVEGSRLLESEQNTVYIRWRVSKKERISQLDEVGETVKRDHWDLMAKTEKQNQCMGFSGERNLSDKCKREQINNFLKHDF